MIDDFSSMNPLEHVVVMCHNSQVCVVVCVVFHVVFSASSTYMQSVDLFCLARALITITWFVRTMVCSCSSMPVCVCVWCVVVFPMCCHRVCCLSLLLSDFIWHIYYIKLFTMLSCTMFLHGALCCVYSQ